MIVTRAYRTGLQILVPRDDVLSTPRFCCTTIVLLECQRHITKTIQACCSYHFGFHVFLCRMMRLKHTYLSEHMVRIIRSSALPNDSNTDRKLLYNEN